MDFMLEYDCWMCCEIDLYPTHLLYRQCYMHSCFFDLSTLWVVDEMSAGCLWVYIVASVGKSISNRPVLALTACCECAESALRYS